MLAALTGLLGILIGVVAKTVSDTLVATRENRRAVKAAVRLVLANLYVAQAVMEPVRKTGNWGPEKGPLPLHGFESHAAVLAGSLDTESWRQMRGSVLGVRRINGILEESMQQGGLLTGADLSDFERIGAHVDMTIGKLRSKYEPVPTERALAASDPAKQLGASPER